MCRISQKYIKIFKVTFYKKKLYTSIIFLFVIKTLYNFAKYEIENFLLLFFLMYFYYAKGKNHPVLSNGDWYEITTSENGIYKIDYVFLSQPGINLSNLNVNSIKLFGNGGGMLPHLNSAFDLMI